MTTALRSSDQSLASWFSRFAIATASEGKRGDERTEYVVLGTWGPPPGSATQVLPVQMQAGGGGKLS